MANGEFSQAGDILLGLSAGLQGRGQQFLANRDAMAQQAVQQQRQNELDRQKTVFTDSLSALNFAKQGRFDLVAQLGANRLQAAAQFPEADFSDTRMLTQMAEMAAQGNQEAADNLTATLENNVAIGQGLGILPQPEDMRTAGEREFASLTQAAGLSEDERERAARVRLGLDARATARTAEREARIAGATEAAKLSARLKLEPAVKSAVQLAVQDATARSAQRKEDRSNQRALDVYDTAISSLESSLSDTATGPIVGRLPALTDNQQIAEGATAVMAPILKQMFRSAGEGTFTDKDQELLLQMVPTRKDSPAAIKAKLANIDAVVKAKLAPVEGRPVQPQEIEGPMQPTQPGVFRFNPATGGFQ